jgi:hypothetical protein
VPLGLAIEFWLRGGSDRETAGGSGSTRGTEGTGNGIDCEVTVGSGRTEELLVSRLIAKPLARPAKRMEETITLENMIFEEKVVKWRKKKGNQA